ncbi:MAG: lipoate--protein ligase family protein [Saprospirales bacterium]|nr:lipoate--protein ligase family protein [Saprospirales bacterium]
MKKDLPIRLIDAARVSSLHSQTIYHALAYAMTPDTPDTVVLSQPGSPYACLGFHQDAGREVDLDYCRQHQIPVIRRETGGGTVFIDEDQLFVQWIFHPENLPRKIDTRFQLFVNPLVDTYQFFGIKAYLYPPNDVHVKGKKIVGTGAAAIGNAEVVTGNFLFDFDSTQMANILQAPNAAFRELFRHSLDQYLTTFKKELGTVPDMGSVKQVYAEKCAAALGRILEPGDFTDAEMEWIEKLDQKFRAEKWLFSHRLPPVPERTVKVHAGVYIGEIKHPIHGGQLCATIRTKGELIDQISFSGDFPSNPFQITRIGESIAQCANGRGELTGSP